MADLSAYWKQIQSSDKFKDLDPDQKERIRSKLFDTYVQTSNSYLNLPQSQRIAVKKHFDEVTAISPEGPIEGLERKGRVLKKEAEPYIQKGKQIEQAIPGAVQKGVMGAEAGLEKVEGAVGSQPIVKKAEAGFGLAEDVSEAIEPAPMRAGYKAIGKASQGIVKGGEALGEAIEPNFIKPSLTAFDTARAIASGTIKTVSKFAAGALPTSFPQTVGYALMDGAQKYAGTTFLGHTPEAPVEGMKTGLSEDAKSMGDMMEKRITQARIEAYGRQGRQAPAGLLKGGSIPMGPEGSTGVSSDIPAHPLEILSHKESEIKAQNEYQQYQDWLDKNDKISASGGSADPDIYPAAKQNVSQLRDAARARLQKLKEEPVRVESLGNAEDELRGYFRKKLSAYPKPGQAIELPEASVSRETPKMLSGRPQPAGLLEEPETPPPASMAPKMNPRTSTKAPLEGIPAYKDFISKSFQKYLPNQSRQAVDNLTGALMGSLKDTGFIHPTRPKPINVDMMNFLDKLVEQASIQEKPVKPIISEDSRLREKGMDSQQVMAEAKRLHSEHTATQGISDYEKFIQENNGIAADPKLKEEFNRNVPIHLRGKTNPDEMAQALFEAGLQPDASSSTMYQKLSERKSAGEKLSVRSFLDEAERNIEHDQKQKAGFVKGDLFSGQKEDLVLRGEEAPEQAPMAGGGQQTTMPGSQAQFPNKPLKDLKQSSTFDIVTDAFKNLGEKGSIGGEIDPVRQAAMEAAVKELVDRAMSMGYQTSQDIMLYAAKNAPSEIRDALRKNLAPTLSPFDNHAYKEVESAKAGNPVAKKSLMDRAMREYLTEKEGWLKGKIKSLKASRQVLIFKDADEATMRLKNELFMFDTYRGHSKPELAAQRWYNEGAAPGIESIMRQGFSEKEAQGMLDLYNHPTDRMKTAKAATQFHEDAWYDLFSEHYDDLGYVENHVTRRWKQPQEYRNWEGQVLQNRPNFMKGRKLITQAQGMDAGLDPVSLDVRDDIKASNNLRVQTLSRIHALTKMALTTDRMGHGSIIDESVDEGMTQAKKAKITPHTGKAPADWLRYRDVSLLRGLAINPEYKPALDYMLSQKFKGWGADWMDWAAGTSKASRLSLSLFHPLSLTEMMMTGSSYRELFSLNMDRNLLFKTARSISKGATAALEDPLKWQSPLTKAGRIHNAGEVTRLYESFMKGSAALGNRPLALDMAERGFQFGGMEEDISNRISGTIAKYQDFLKKRIENPGRPQDVKAYKEALGTSEGVRAANDVFQKGLWSYMHQGFSMSLYESQVADNIRKFNLMAPEGKKIPVDKIKMDTANFVKKEMGGISYSRLLVTPRMQQILQWSLLAPSWTIGRLLMGAAVFESGPEGRQARKQALRMALAYGVTGNVANYFSTKAQLGKGRFMWDNPEGQKLNVFWKKEEGKAELYVQGSKASTEIFEDLTHPMRTLAGKASPPIQAAVKIMDWSKAPSGTPYTENPFQAGVDMFTPGTLAGSSAYSIAPVHKGVTPSSVARLFDKFYQTGDMKYQDEAVKFADEAGINWEPLNRAAKGRSTSARHKKERQELFQ